MARTFTAASSHKLAVASVVASAAPITMACWYKPTNIATAYNVMSIMDATEQEGFRLRQSATGLISAGCGSLGVFTAAFSSAAATAGAWNHGAAVYATASSRSAYLNGGNKGTDAGAKTPGAMTQTGVSGPASGFFDGAIAWPAIWTAALSDGEIAALAAGLDPRLLQSQRAKLVFFAPLIGASPEPDVVGGLSLTVTGATRSDDPGNLIYATGRTRQVPPGNRYVGAA